MAEGCEAGITSPIDEIDVAEIYVPFSWFEPMWLENLGFAGPGGLAAHRGGRDATRRPAAGQPVRRGALLQPDRRVRAAAFCRGGVAGHGQGGRPPGGRGADRAWPRLRRRLAVLLDVGAGGHPGLGAAAWDHDGRLPGRRRGWGAVSGPVGVTLARKAAVYKVELSGQSRFKRTYRGAEQGGMFCVASDAPRAGRGLGSAAERPGSDR